MQKSLHTESYMAEIKLFCILSVKLMARPHSAKWPECVFLPSSQRSSVGGKKGQKKTREESDSEEDYSPDPDEDDEDEHAEEHPPPPATASWSSDHNYIAVMPEKTAPMSPTVLNKKCMYLLLLLKPHCCFSIINVLLVALTV